MEIRILKQRENKGPPIRIGFVVLYTICVGCHKNIPKRVWRLRGDPYHPRCWLREVISRDVLKRDRERHKALETYNAADVVAGKGAYEDYVASTTSQEEGRRSERLCRECGTNTVEPERTICGDCVARVVGRMQDALSRYREDIAPERVDDALSRHPLTPLVRPPEREEP